MADTVILLLVATVEFLIICAPPFSRKDANFRILHT